MACLRALRVPDFKAEGRHAKSNAPTASGNPMGQTTMNTKATARVCLYALVKEPSEFDSERLIVDSRPFSLLGQP